MPLSNVTFFAPFRYSPRWRSENLSSLVRNSADLALQAGEYVVHEGGERALFAVLSGKIEVVKQFDGVLRTLGWRLPGTIFGEVPLAFATPFPVAAIVRPNLLG